VVASSSMKARVQRLPLGLSVGVLFGCGAWGAGLADECRSFRVRRRVSAFAIGRPNWLFARFVPSSGRRPAP
jgi:hypothetical protein